MQSITASGVTFPSTDKLESLYMSCLSLLYRLVFQEDTIVLSHISKNPHFFPAALGFSWGIKSCCISIADMFFCSLCSEQQEVFYILETSVLHKAGGQDSCWMGPSTCVFTMIEILGLLSFFKPYCYFSVYVQNL